MKDIYKKFNYRFFYSKRMQTIFLFVLVGIFYAFLTYGYAIFNTVLSVNTDLAVRPERDVRITSVSNPSYSNGGYETSESQYSHDYLNVTGVLPNSNSTISYVLTITNKTDVDKTINQIIDNTTTSDVSYSIGDFELGKTIIPANQSIEVTITFSNTSKKPNVTFNSELIFIFGDVIIDIDPPIIVFNPNGTDNWVNKDVTVSLSATDESGVASFSYCIGNTDCEPNLAADPTGANVLITEGENKICAKAIDKADPANQSTQCSKAYLIDKTPPTLTIDGCTDDSCTMEVEKNSNFTLPQGVATDNLSGATITTSGSVNTSVVNTYYITYTAVDGAKNETSKTLTVIIKEPEKVDTSGANAPVLSSTMIPIKRNNDNTAWITTRNGDDWYNYDEARWANVAITTEASRAKYSQTGVTVDENDVLLYLVWIPRYKYTVPSGSGEREVSVIFESGTNTTGTGNGNGDGAYYTHPAFTFNGVEKTGFWVAKFETGKYQGSDISTWTSDGAIGYSEGDYMVSKPNVYTWRGLSVGQEFEISRSIETNSVYGINSTMNTHMSNNVEWGAIAYLSHSKYGYVGDIRFNNSNTYVTGCAASYAPNTTSTNPDSGFAGCENAYDTPTGFLASTTQNIYGIYDMSGGAYEHVAGYIDGYPASSGIDPTDYPGYFNAYEPRGSWIFITGIKNWITGDAAGSDPVAGWYDDFGSGAAFNTINAWVRRGGDYTYGKQCGLFYYNSANGGTTESGTFRLIITP